MSWKDELAAMVANRGITEVADEVAEFLRQTHQAATMGAGRGRSLRSRQSMSTQRRVVSLTEHFASGKRAMNLEQFKALRARQAGGAR
jgi:hypothetical protein